MRAPQSAQVSELPAGNIKVTRQDWLNCARARLIQSGIAEVKILSLGAELGVSRSSFYWYFESRQDLCDALLAEWENTNTAILRQHAAAPADTITKHLNSNSILPSRRDHSRTAKSRCCSDAL